jgi:hypothetical protein
VNGHEVIGLAPGVGKTALKEVVARNMQIMACYPGKNDPHKYQKISELVEMTRYEKGNRATS